MNIITDEQLAEFPMAHAVTAIGDFFAAARNGQVISPPRHSVKAGNGGLTFTIGAELATTKTIGFRVYDTYPGRSGTDSDQIVAVYSTEASQLKGLVLGSKLGAIRTAAINGYAIQTMAKEKVGTACIIGAGHHASYQLEALLAVRTPDMIIICNRTRAKAEALATTMQRKHNHAFVVGDDIASAVRQSDVVLCATSSATPVVDTTWLADGTYISSIGPKFKGRHELPMNIHDGAAQMVSDAPDQLAAYQAQYFLDDLTSIQPLESVNDATNRPGHRLFLSTGRSGTEVVVADRIIAHFS